MQISNNGNYISIKIMECSACLLFLYPQVPKSPQDWMTIARGYESRWNFPHCVGALDGKHVVLQSPENSGSYFFNYKKTHSIVLMALVDAEYRFIYVDVGCNGRISDGGVFKNCSLGRATDDGLLNLPMPTPLPNRNKHVPYVIVADEAFPLKENIMKPYAYASTGPSRIFNYRLSRARRVVENVFGILANRFRVLRSAIMLCPEKAEMVVLASCVLHNFLRSSKTSSDMYMNCGSVDRENGDGTMVEGDWRRDPTSILTSVGHQGARNSSQASKDIRNEFTDYFVDEGSVPWQWKHL
jgi:hypothetical protein